MTTGTAAATETLEHTLQLYRIPAAASQELLDAQSDDEVDDEADSATEPAVGIAPPAGSMAA